MSPTSYQAAPPRINVSVPAVPGEEKVPQEVPGVKGFLKACAKIGGGEAARGGRGRNRPLRPPATGWKRH